MTGLSETEIVACLGLLYGLMVTVQNWLLIRAMEKRHKQ